jgi:hypothetical protein
MKFASADFVSKPLKNARRNMEIHSVAPEQMSRNHMEVPRAWMFVHLCDVNYKVP